MSKLEKAIERLKSHPKDYTYSEAKQLLKQLGFQEYQKGKTSGSRVKFYRLRDNRVILLHKPHLGNELNTASVNELVRYLKELNEI